MKAATDLFGSIMLGAAVWASWLWDSDYDWNERLGFWQGHTAQGQVIGCALTYILVAAVSSTRLHPVLVTFGMARGFWIVWNVQAATADETGLFLVGSSLLGLALLLGGTIASAWSGRFPASPAPLRPPR